MALRTEARGVAMRRERGRRGKRKKDNKRKREWPCLVNRGGKERNGEERDKNVYITRGRAV